MSRTPLLLFAFLLGLSAAGPCLAAPADQAARDYLEGIWILGEKPDQGACVSHWYKATQAEFEFRKSGGRVLMHEPFDLFIAAAVPDIEIKGDVVTLMARSREGKVAPLLSLRRLGPDQFQWLDESGEPSATAYRCGPPDRSVNDSVPMASLALLTPLLSGALTFPEIRSAEDPREVCKTAGPLPDGSPRRALQFEVLGPAHYWVFGEGYGKREAIEFDRVRSVRQTDAHTLTLDMEEHPKGGQGWDAPVGPDKRYTLTVIDKGDRLEIPELSAAYVRCRPDEPASYGMHRMS